MSAFITGTFFQNIDLRRHPVLGVINGILLSGQKLLKIKRNQDVHFTKGSNWFSCTDGFARYLLTKEEWVLQVLDKTFCSDEFFVQTLIVQSPYQDKIYQGRVIPVPCHRLGQRQSVGLEIR